MSGINVQIGANAAPLKKGLAEAETALKGFDSSIGSTLANVGKMAGVAAAAGLALSVHLVKGAFAAIDAQSKLAQQLATTNGELVSIQRAADLAGVGAEEMAVNLKRLNNTLGEAQGGSKKAQETIAQFGVTAAEMAAMPLSERMQVLSTTFSGLKDQTQAAALAQDLFGKAGQQMLPMLQDGGEQLRIAAEQTKAWGMQLSDVDAAKVEAANDSISSISLVMDGFINRVAVKFAPLVDAIGKAFEETATETGGFKGAAESAFNFVIKVAGFVADAIRGLQVVLKGLEIVWHGIRAAVLVASLALSHFIDLIPGIDMSESNKEITQFLVNATSSFTQAKTEFGELMKAPMPSVALDDFLTKVNAASEQAAQAAVAARDNAMATATGVVEPAGGGAAKPAAAAADTGTIVTEDFAAALAAQQVTLDEAAQLRAVADEAQRQERYSAIADEIATEVSMEEQKQSLLSQATKAGQEQRLAWEKMTGDARVKSIAGSLAEMTASTANSNKKMFELNKAAGITNAIINTYEGVTKALASYPPPISFAMAGAQLAAGMAQVSAIKSQSFGGGKTSAPAATAPSAIAGTGGGGTGGGGGGAAREVVVSGINPNDIFSGTQLVELINRAQRDGAVVMRFA